MLSIKTRFHSKKILFVHFNNSVVKLPFMSVIMFNMCIKSVTVYQGFRDTAIGQRIIRDLYTKNFTPSIEISM